MWRTPSRRNCQRPFADVVRGLASGDDAAALPDLVTSRLGSLADGDAEADAATPITALGSSTDNATSFPARCTLAMPRWVGSTSAKSPYEISGGSESVQSDRSISTA